MNVETANRLQTLRKKNGYSQEELAEKIGISRQAVSKWERAEASPDTDNLILLAKLYGVTLDELLKTDSVPMPDSEGISLRKEDYIGGEYSRSYVDDDGEIYPGGRPSVSGGDVSGSYSEPQGAPGVAYGEAAQDNSAQAGQSDGHPEQAQQNGSAAGFIKSVAGFTVNVTKQAIDTTAKALSEADGKMKNGESLESAVESSFEKHFENFGKNFENIDKDFENFDKKFENFDKKFENIGKNIEKKFAGWENKPENCGGVCETAEGNAHSGKPEPKNTPKEPATLLDKLFPLIVVCVFLLFCAVHLYHPTWLIFFAIPVYYIWVNAFRKYRRGEKSFGEAFISFVDGALPLGVTFLFLASGFLFGYWYFVWTIFFLIPLYYTGKEAIKKRNLLIFCYPVVAVWAYICCGFLFNWTCGLVFLMTIPFYYIIIDHLQKKSKK